MPELGSWETPHPAWPRRLLHEHAPGSSNHRLQKTCQRHHLLASAKRLHPMVPCPCIFKFSNIAISASREARKLTCIFFCFSCYAARQPTCIADQEISTFDQLFLTNASLHEYIPNSQRLHKTSYFVRRAKPVIKPHLLPLIRSCS